MPDFVLFAVFFVVGFIIGFVASDQWRLRRGPHDVKRMANEMRDLRKALEDYNERTPKG